MKSLTAERFIHNYNKILIANEKGIERYVTMVTILNINILHVTLTITLCAKFTIYNGYVIAQSTSFFNRYQNLKDFN